MRAPDATHLNRKGSVLVGRIVADELAVVVPELAPHLKPTAADTQAE